MIKLIKLIIRLGIVALLAVALIVMINLEKNPEICEAVTRGYARFRGMIMSKISSVVPFSLTELCFVTLGVGVLILLILTIRLLVKKRIFGAFYRLVEIVAIVLLSFDVYHISCEFAYRRDPIPLPYYENKVQREEYVNIFNYYADDLNYCISQLEFEETGEAKTSMSLDDIAKEVKEAYKIIDGNNYFSPYCGSVKPMLSSFAYVEFQITGVTYSPLMEANIVTTNTKTNIPFTVAHEIAHTKGVMREDEANQLAFYVCLNSNHPFLRYSAYIDYFNQIETLATDNHMKDEELEQCHREYRSAYSKSLSYEYKFWKKHNLMKNIGDFFNNLYIKSSGVKEGTTSYSGGTNYETDKEAKEITKASNYQKLFFEKYYRASSI